MWFLAFLDSFKIFFSSLYKYYYDIWISYNEYAIFHLESCCEIESED